MKGVYLMDSVNKAIEVIADTVVFDVNNPALEFTEARSRFYIAKDANAKTKKELDIAKSIYQRSMDVMNKIVQRDLCLLNDEEPRITVETRIAEVVKPTCPLKMAGEIIEKEGLQSTLKMKRILQILTPEEKKEWKEKVHPWIQSNLPSDIASKIGIHSTTVYAWTYKGTSPSKSNYDQLVALMNSKPNFNETKVAVSRYEKITMDERKAWVREMYPFLKKMDIVTISTKCHINLSTMKTWFALGSYPNKLNFDILAKFIEKNKR
jgi:hypothetical protein